MLALSVEGLWEPRRGEFALKVRGKGSRDRLVPLAPAVCRRLRRHLTARAADRRDPVFVALRKGADRGYAALTKSGLGINFHLEVTPDSLSLSA
ncbi:MAG TPA: hypothetical protein VMV23_01575 [Candidatus Nanopelagicaceae bacterium]|nr:hypothetical protein [Candidatus Nanopelagicaceae bacterium]